MLALGIFAGGYPQHDQFTSLGAQLLGIVVMASLGFVPGYLLSLVLKKKNLLRVSKEDELLGLDIAELGIEGVVPDGAIIRANN